ncbi:hypothetical protein COOONC_26997 [Cooperia oncophora]
MRRSWKTQYSSKHRTQNFPSPLLAVNFWRICLDESQLVASKVKAAAKMCSMLKSRYRWCVTGTPMSNSVNGEFIPALSGIVWYRGYGEDYVRRIPLGEKLKTRAQA